MAGESVIRPHVNSLHGRALPIESWRVAIPEPRGLPTGMGTDGECPTALPSVGLAGPGPDPTLGRPVSATRDDMAVRAGECEPVSGADSLIYREGRYSARSR